MLRGITRRHNHSSGSLLCTKNHQGRCKQELEALLPFCRQFYEAANRHDWTDDAGDDQIDHDVLQAEGEEQGVMPALYALAQHAAVADVGSQVRPWLLSWKTQTDWSCSVHLGAPLGSAAFVRQLLQEQSHTKRFHTTRLVGTATNNTEISVIVEAKGSRLDAKTMRLQGVAPAARSPARCAVRGASPATPTSPAAGSSSRETAYARIAATASLPARHGDAGCAVLRQDAQERGCFGAEASDFDPDYDEPRTCGTVEFGVGLAPFASGCILHGGCRAGVRARPCGAGPGDGADDSGIDRKRGTMPHGHRARGRVEVRKVRLEGALIAGGSGSA
eukprot:s127_g22.t1